jgi:hypothetical protein
MRDGRGFSRSEFPRIADRVAVVVSKRAEQQRSLSPSHCDDGSPQVQVDRMDDSLCEPPGVKSRFVV